VIYWLVLINLGGGLFDMLFSRCLDVKVCLNDFRSCALPMGKVHAFLMLQFDGADACLTDCKVGVYVRSGFP